MAEYGKPWPLTEILLTVLHFVDLRTKPRPTPGAAARSSSRMAHIHERIDFTVAIFVVHADRVLVIHHRKLDRWLPLGGHIELMKTQQAARSERRKRAGGGIAR
jgi:hypothetical protein